MTKTLDEHNKERNEFYNAPKPSYNSAQVKCNECGTEMICPNPHVVLASYPAQQHVQCPNCGRTGLKVV